MIPDPHTVLDHITRLRWEITKAAYLAAEAGVPQATILEDAAEGAQFGG